VVQSNKLSSVKNRYKSSVTVEWAKKKLKNTLQRGHEGKEHEIGGRNCLSFQTGKEHEGGRKKRKEVEKKSPLASACQNVMLLTTPYPVS
jgi:hypothetical protein